MINYLRYFLAHTVGFIWFDFKGKNRIIELLWNERTLPVIKKTVRLSVSKQLINVQSDSHIGWNILVYGTYEKKLIDRMLRLTKNGPRRVAIDIGANIGQYSLICSKYFQKVYSFEPVPFFHKKLLENLRLNSINNVTAIPCALGSVESMIQMVIVKYQGVAQTASVDRGKGIVDDRWETIQVPQYTLDCKISKEVIDYIKIDTDGTEHDILLGATQLLSSQNPLIQIELIDGVKQWRGEKLLSDTVRLLKSYGYEFFDQKGKLMKDKHIYQGNYFATKPH